MVLTRACILNPQRILMIQRYANTTVTTRRSLASNSHVKGASSAGIGPIGQDGRHELWREGQSSDHDNEPRYVRFILLSGVGRK